MKTAQILLFAVFLLLSAEMRSQGKFVQFIVVGLESESDCRLLMDSLRTHDGWGAIRAESVYKNFYGTFMPGVEFSEQEIRSWLLPLGFDISCFRTGTLGVDEVRRLKSKECDLLQQRRE